MTEIRNEEDLKNAIKETFKGKRVKVYLFGSRAKGTHSERSDYDLGFLSEENIRKELTLLREIVENSNFPYFVDFVDLSEVDKDFKNRVLKEGKLWINLENN
jgi:predicted nucleotidyltransferase